MSLPKGTGKIIINLLQRGCTAAMRDVEVRRYEVELLRANLRAAEELYAHAEAESEAYQALLQLVKQQGEVGNDG